MMTRKDYKQFAGMLAALRANLNKEFESSDGAAFTEDLGYGRALIDVENAMVRIFAQDNGRFSSSKFRSAAQPRNAR